MYTPRIAVIWAQYRRTFIALAIMVLVVVAGWLLGLKGSLVAAIATLVGLLTAAFTGLIGLVGLIPGIGPLIIKVLSIPFIWLMNGAGYFTALFLAQRGHARSVVDSRVLTVMFLIGVVIGFIIGKIV
jgi:hypothetical protein